MKKIYLIIILLFSVFTSNAQNLKSKFYRDTVTVDSLRKKGQITNFSSGGSNNGFVPDVIPPSPNAASMVKYGDITVNLSAGLPNLSIPLYTATERNITVPISVSYRYSGFRPSEDGGALGRGWALNAGGVITRTQKGAWHDEKIIIPESAHQGGYLVSGVKTAQVINPQTGVFSCTGSTCPPASQFLDTYDGEPDLFNFVCDKASGKFFFGTDGVAKIVSDQKLKIDYVWNKNTVFLEGMSYQNLTHFTITTEDGTIYRFGFTGATPMNIDIAYSTTEHVISAWHLYEIEAPTGEKVSFTYTNDFINAANQIQKTHATTSMTQNYVSASDGSQWQEQSPQPFVSRSAETFLKTIEGTNWKVELTNVDYTIGLPITLNSSKQLQSLKISAKTSPLTTLKSFDFTYDGLSNTALLTSIQEKDSQGSISIPAHLFEYYNTSIPTTTNGTSINIDFWNYYNGAFNSTLLPQFGANRNPNLTATSIGALKKITYPTGGTSEFEYELNEFSYIRDTPYSNTRATHGGLRVKKITNTPVIGLPIVKTYQYNDFNNTARSSGIVGEITIPYSISSTIFVSCSKSIFTNSCPTNNSITYTIFKSEPFYQMSKDPVYYYNVREITNGNSRADHVFTSHFDFPDFLGQAYGLMNASVGGVSSEDFARSLPKNIKYYNNSTDLISEKQYNYTLVDRYKAPTYYIGVAFVRDQQGESFTFSKGLNTYSGWLQKTGETDISYAGTAALTTNSVYTYGNSTYLQMTGMSVTESKAKPITLQGGGTIAEDRKIETTLKYPYDYATDAIYVGMVNKNIISPVIEKTVQLSIKNTNGTTTYVPVNYEKTTYNLFGTSYLPQKIETQIGSGTLITPITFDSYDTRGNVSKYTTRKGEVTNLTYYGTTDYGKTDLLKTYSIGGGSTGTVLQRSMSYDYKPLVGLLSATDINGYSINYQYDASNRLMSVKDKDNNFLKDFNYHYANQTALTGLGITPTNAMNYVISRTAREAQTGTTLSSTVENTTTQIQYLDGLGKSLQSLIWQGSPDKTKDIISSTSVYDAYGRANKSILTTPSDGILGAYKSTALALANTFYADTCAYTQTFFESSPLNRPLKEFGAGQAWKVANKYILHQYLLAGNGITSFDVTTDSTVTCSNSYPASSLLNDCVKSERGVQSYVLKDKQGRITHQYQEMDAGFAIVGYAYNDLGLLSYVIPPETYKKLGTGLIPNFKKSHDIFKEGIFSYAYDGIGNVVEKHIPGGGTTRYVLDKYDRIVLENDDKDSSILWKMTKYDALGRPILKGILTDIGTATRQTVQTNFDNFGNISTNYGYEDRGTDLLGYTNRSFPTAYPVADANIKHVMYYDDYLWNPSYNFDAANAFHAQGLAKGLMTGQLKRNLKTGTWEKFVYYYDYRGKLIQEFYLSNRGNLIRKDYQYRFNGELLKVRIEKKSGANVISTKILTYQYDHLGRKVKYNHFLNGTDKSIATYSYDDIGRLNKKSFSPISVINSLQTGSWNATTTWIGSNIPTLSDNVTINTGHTVTINTGEAGSAGSLFDKGKLTNNGSFYLGSLKPATTATELHSLNYKYHIRGLRGINLDANNDLTNSLFSFKLTYEDDTAYYDNNIRNQYWKSNIDGIKRAYEFSYDKASRLIGAAYSSSKTGENYALNSVSYDDNGNIKTLSRNGATNSNYTAFGNVDNLTYTYQTNSNKLQKIADATTSNADLGDFRDASNTDNDYTYWQDGSLKKDKNKKIASITYNYLKLPEVITFENARTVTTEYDAGGTKLKKIDSNGETTDYEEDEIYVNGNLYQTSHDEGRISNGIYEYNITDHNKDLRVSFRDSLGIAVPTQSIFYDPWGLSMKGMAITRNTTNFNKYQFLNRETQFETGYIDLIHRQYDPQTGRFTSQDPVIDGQEHLSLYQYGWNNPILKPDPDGLVPPCCGGPIYGFQLVQGVVNNFNKILSYTDANDATVLATTLTRGENAINVDGTKATTTDKVMAGVGAAIPIVSGSALKKIGGAIVEGIVDAVKGGEKVKEISPNVKKVLDTIDKIKNSGGEIQVNKLKAADKQELNMTFKSKDGSKLDLRVETHEVPKSVGGNGTSPQRHLNADVTNSSGNRVKMKHINGGHKILE